MLVVTLIPVFFLPRKREPLHLLDERARRHAGRDALTRRTHEGLAALGGPLRSFRCTLYAAAWAIGLSTIRSTLTCWGRVATQTMASAMSSATSGSRTPA